MLKIFNYRHAMTTADSAVAVEPKFTFFFGISIILVCTCSFPFYSNVVMLLQNHYTTLNHPQCLSVHASTSHFPHWLSWWYCFMQLILIDISTNRFEFPPTGAEVAVTIVTNLQAVWPDFNFSLCHRIETGPGAHSASYQSSTVGCFPRAKAARPWSWPLTSI
jgi:hypothetical protein